jgi:DNA-binding transcriptional MerR regulator
MSSWRDGRTSFHTGSSAITADDMNLIHRRLEALEMLVMMVFRALGIPIEGVQEMLAAPETLTGKAREVVDLLSAALADRRADVSVDALKKLGE